MLIASQSGGSQGAGMCICWIVVYNADLILCHYFKSRYAVAFSEVYTNPNNMHYGLDAWHQNPAPPAGVGKMSVPEGYQQTNQFAVVWLPGMRVLRPRQWKVKVSFLGVTNKPNRLLQDTLLKHARYKIASLEGMPR